MNSNNSTRYQCIITPACLTRITSWVRDSMDQHEIMCSQCMAKNKYFRETGYRLELQPYTIPSTIIQNLGLNEGDQLDIYEDNGSIRLIPVTVYPKGYVDQLHSEINQLKADNKSGRRPVFENLDSLFASLDEASDSSDSSVSKD